MTTRRRSEVLAYVEAYYAQHGYAPGYREIAEGCDLKSTATARYHVLALIKEGVLNQGGYGLSRSLTLGGRAPLIEDLRGIAAQLDGHPAQIDVRALLERLEG